MFSFQRLLGREDEFTALLEASAYEAGQAVACLKRMLVAHPESIPLDEFAATRRKGKRIAEEIAQKLITTFVTPLEREDLEALAESLYKIPKTAEKFAERYGIVAAQIRDIDFTPQVELLEKAVQIVLRMVQALREGRNLTGLAVLQRELQVVESTADDVLVDMSRRFYEPGFPALQAIILKDLFALNEKAIDRCRDAGNAISRALLKNA